MNHASLFSGIGGFDLAAQWMGWHNVFHCEIDIEFCQKILKYYWPNAITYTDIRTTDFTIHRGRIDILTGGFPCQPYSTAGKRKGKEDDRHLWPEMLRAIREIKPPWIVGENVRGIINWNKGLVFGEIQDDLESEGYEVIPIEIPAINFGVNNLRERVWFVAHSISMGRQDIQNHFEARFEQATYAERDWTCRKERIEEADVLDSPCNHFSRFREMYGQPAIFSVDDELPFELDGITVPKWIGQSFKAAGNAVNVEVVLEIFKAIESVNSTL